MADGKVPERRPRRRLGRDGCRRIDGAAPISLIGFAGPCLMLALIPVPDTVLVLGLTPATIGFLHLAAIAFVAFKAMQWRRRPKVNTAVERAGSGVLAVLGTGMLASGASS